MDDDDKAFKEKQREEQKKLEGERDCYGTGALDICSLYFLDAKKKATGKGPMKLGK